MVYLITSFQIVNTYSAGYICKRENVKGNGCCKVNVEETTRYSCEKCHNASGCCSVYENCISCCMHPLNVRKIFKLSCLRKIQFSALILFHSQSNTATYSFSET